MPLKHLIILLTLLLSVATGLVAQEQQSETAPVVSPFAEDDDLRLLEEKRREDAMLKEEQRKEEAVLKEETRRSAIQIAIAPIKVLARGMQDDRSVVILALDPTRRTMISKGESIMLNTTAGAVELRLKTVTKQTLQFELNDGTILPIQ